MYDVCTYISLVFAITHRATFTVCVGFYLWKRTQFLLRRVLSTMHFSYSTPLCTWTETTKNKKNKKVEYVNRIYRFVFNHPFHLFAYYWLFSSFCIYAMRANQADGIRSVHHLCIYVVHIRARTLNEDILNNLTVPSQSISQQMGDKSGWQI